MKHVSAFVLSMALIVSWLLGACSSGPSASPPANGDQGNTAEQVDLPGTEEFGMTKEELVKSAEAVESGIAACMHDAGFEYIAVDFKTVRKGMVADKSLPGLSERQFADQYGYGISTLYTGQDPQQADATTPAKIGLGPQNLKIFDNLSPADQVSYNRALLGEHLDATFAVTLEGENFSRVGGCTATAIEQTFSPEQLAVTYYNPLDAMVDQDPRMVAALGEYADCMQAAGFEYAHPNDPEQDIKQRLDIITNAAPLESLPDDDRAALTELQGEERAIAAADYKCRVKLVEPVEDKILRELYSGAVQ